MEMSVRFWQLEKVNSSMEVTLFPKITDLRELHDEKENPSMNFTELGIVMVTIELHDPNELLPIVSNLDLVPNVIVRSSEHPLNEIAPMVVRESGNEISVRLEQE